MPLINIENNIAARRGDMKQRELSEAVGISQTWVSMIENGKAFPTADELERIAAALKCEPSDLYEAKWLSVIGFGNNAPKAFTVEVPAYLAEKIDERLDGFSDRREFVIDAIRRRCML